MPRLLRAFPFAKGPALILRMHFTKNNPVKMKWVKVAICSVALGWSVSPASADVRRYLYELSTKSGDFLYAGEISVEAKPPTKCSEVTTDNLGRVTQVVRQVNGEMTSETIYQFEADTRLPSGFETIAANGETTGQNRIQRDADGDRIRVDEFTVTGELAEYLTRMIGSDHVEEIWYTALGKPKGDRVVRYYSPAGILVRSRRHVSGSVYYEIEYDVRSGLIQSEKKFKDEQMVSFDKVTYDDSGELLREDIYSANNLWYGSREYADDLEMVEEYKWPGGSTEELRHSYDANRRLKEVTLYHNEQFICVLKYDRLSTGAIKRTFALGEKGQVFAVYPGLEVDIIDRHGHSLDQPDLGAIYREGNWW
jgi:hypothetical protein